MKHDSDEVIRLDYKDYSFVSVDEGKPGGDYSVEMTGTISGGCVCITGVKYEEA